MNFPRSEVGPFRFALTARVSRRKCVATAMRDLDSPWQQDGQKSAGYWIPAAQVPDGLTVLPLDGVFEQVGQPPAAGDAGDVGDPAAGPDRDDEPLVVEGERLQRPALQLRVRLRATVSPSSSATCASGAARKTPATRCPRHADARGPSFHIPRQRHASGE